LKRLVEAQGGDRLGVSVVNPSTRGRVIDGARVGVTVRFRLEIHQFLRETRPEARSCIAMDRSVCAVTMRFDKKLFAHENAVMAWHPIRVRIRIRVMGERW